MDRQAFLLATSAISVAAATGVSVPTSTLATDAMQLAKSSLPVEVYNHCLRTYLFADLMAKAHRIDFDAELTFVASILHDLGLSAAHMSDAERFEVDGANAARKLLATHGVRGTRADTVWDAIALHDAGGIARWKQAEVMLVNAGVGADFGGGLSMLRREDVIAVLHAAPRTNFTNVFIDAVAVVAQKKPSATGNCFVVDVGIRRVPGFHPYQLR